MESIIYKPEVSIAEIMAYDPKRPETHTRSAFMNAVCESFARNGFLNCKEMGRSIGMSDRKFSYTFEVLTGVKYAKLRAKLVEHKGKELRQQHPGWSANKIAQALGFRSRTSLWSLLPKSVYKQMIPETKGEFLRRMAAEFDRKSKLD